MPERRSSLKYRLLRLALACVVGSSCLGCRSLRPGQHTRDLLTARQLSLRGADALQQEKWSDAEALFAEALRHSTADDRAQSGFAEVLWQRQQAGEATRHMLEAAELSGGNPDYLVRLGQMYLEQNDFEKAAQQADSALQSHRSHAAAWTLKADVLRRQGKLDQAIEHYHRALIHQPDSPLAQIAVAELYRSIGRPQRALATLERLADRRSPEEIPPRAWLLKGQALADLGARAEAIASLREAAMHAAENQSLLLVEVAQAQHLLGDIVDARICLGRVLQQDPQNPRALALQQQLAESFERMAALSDIQKAPNY